MKSKKIVSLIVVLFAVGIISGLKAFLNFSQREGRAGNLVRSKGALHAPVRIVEFIDFQCPACAQGAVYLKKFMEEHPGTVRLEMKYFPLSGHQHSFMSSRYAECAARQKKFWSFHDILIERQDQWKGMVNAMSAFDQMAGELGLDRQRLDQCLHDEKTEQIIQKDKEEGTSLGIQSTPTYFVNGKMVVGMKSLAVELEALLKSGNDRI